MREKKIFVNNNLRIKDLLRDYYFNECIGKEIHEIIISFDNTMDQVYGLAACISRDIKGIPNAYYSIFKANIIGDVDFKDVNNFGEVDYNGFEDLETFKSIAELKFLKRRFLNIIEIIFDNTEIQEKFKSLGM